MSNHEKEQKRGNFSTKTSLGTTTGITTGTTTGNKLK
jgi:hypothetical protein